jgi:hypothetical protein
VPVSSSGHLASLRFEALIGIKRARSISVDSWYGFIRTYKAQDGSNRLKFILSPCDKECFSFLSSQLGRTRKLRSLHMHVQRRYFNRGPLWDDIHDVDLIPIKGVVKRCKHFKKLTIYVDGKTRSISF